MKLTELFLFLFKIGRLDGSTLFSLNKTFASSIKNVNVLKHSISRRISPIRMKLHGMGGGEV